MTQHQQINNNNNLTTTHKEWKIRWFYAAKHLSPIMDRSQHDSLMLIGLIRHGGHPCGQHWLLSLIVAENEPQYICLLVLSGLVKVRGTRNSIVKINQTDFTLVTVFAIVTVIVFSLVHARLFRCSSVFTSCSSSPNIYLISTDLHII